LTVGPGFMYKQTDHLRGKALWWWADIAVKACALGLNVFLVENLETFRCEHAFALPICSVDARSKDSGAAYGLGFLLVRWCILVCMVH